MATHKVIKKARSVGKTDQPMIITEGNPVRYGGASGRDKHLPYGLGVGAGTMLGAMVVATEIAMAEPLALTQNAAAKTILNALGAPDKSQPPPRTLDHTDPLAKFIRVKFDGEIRPDDVLSYNVAEGWIECGRYTTINGVRRWKRERGHILSYRKIGRVEPFWR